MPPPRAPALLALLAACAAPTPWPPPSPTTVAWLERVDFKSRESDVVNLLREYLRTDTRNPPGNESRGTALLAAHLQRAGVASTEIPLEPGRAALVARLPGVNPGAPALCLVHHVDTATAEDDGWPPGKGPLSGTLDSEGFLWGRGALDMKALGAMETVALMELARLRVPLRRPVTLVAVPDEEVDNRGMALLVEKHWDLLHCGHAINEGGLGVRDMLTPGQTVFAIGVAEKGVLWLRMTARGEGGHGSVILPDRAPARLVRAAQRIIARAPGVTVHPAYRELLARVGAHRGGLRGWALGNGWLVDAGLSLMVRNDPMLLGAVADTVQVTGLEGARAPNVVPPQASALLDCRLLPGRSPESMLDELRALVDDDQVDFTVLHAAAGNESPWDDDVFRALATHAVAGRPDAVAGPALAPLYSDSVALRRMGTRAYGLTPVAVDRALLRTMHGAGERVPVDELHRGLRSLLGAVLESAAAAPPP